MNELVRWRVKDAGSDECDAYQGPDHTQVLVRKAQGDGRQSGEWLCEVGAKLIRTPRDQRPKRRAGSNRHDRKGMGPTSHPAGLVVLCP
jgi:hypothetical protein